MMIEMGKIVTTPGAAARFGKVFIAQCLARHACGDWGDVGPDTRHGNDHAEEEQSSIFSVYHGNGGMLWIITEWDRSVTTVLLPEEY